MSRPQNRPYPRSNLPVFCAFLALAGVSHSVAAEDALEWDGYVGMTHDYRDRGLSLVRDDFAPQGLLRLRIGGDVQIRSLLTKADDGRGRGVRLLNSASYGFDTAGYRLTLGAALDSFHGGDQSALYPSITGEIARDFGVLYTSLALSHSPDGTWLTPQNASLYLQGSLELPIPKVPKMTLIGHWGYDSRDGLKDAFDWRAGVSLFLSDVELLAEIQGSTIQQAFLADETGSFDFGKTGAMVTVRFYF